MSFHSVGVVGLGLLGRGIAACLVSRGLRVIAYDCRAEARRTARAHIDGAIQDLVRRGGFSESLLATWADHYMEADSLETLDQCDFVIESVTEDLATKRQVFDALEAVVGGDVPIASNTSALPISILQQGRRKPERFVGMHWAEPCHLTRFLEVIRGEATDDTTADATMSLGRAVGKDPSLVRKDVEGFIINRLGYAIYREAFWLLENDVADVETIDRTFRNAVSVWANIAGPFRWMDLTGVPAYAAVMKRLFPQLSCATEVPQQMRELVESGAQGISNGRGFYSYTPQEAEQWERLLVENVWRVRDLVTEILPEEQA